MRTAGNDTTVVTPNSCRNYIGGTALPLPMPEAVGYKELDLGR